MQDSLAAALVIQNIQNVPGGCDPQTGRHVESDPIGLVGERALAE
jgi:hypothetical protein